MHAFLPALFILLVTTACSLAVPPTKNPDAQALQQLLDNVYQRRLDANPVLASSLGVSSTKLPWFDLSLSAWDREATDAEHDLASLRSSIDYESLGAADKVNYRAFETELLLRLNRYRWRYHLNPINQIVGPHLTIAGTLLNNHPIESLEDAEFYIERMRTVPAPMRQLAVHLLARRERGIYIPVVVVERLIDGAESVIAGDGQSNTILSDFETKLAVLNMESQDRVALLEEAALAYAEGFEPGYQLLIDALRQEMAVEFSGGAWAFPDGDAFYEFLIDQYTTADFTAAEIHSLGLAEVARIQGEMNAIRSRLGFSGDLAAFFEYLKTDPAFYFANTNDGRQKYLELAQGLVNNAKDVMGRILPYPLPHPFEVRRIESFREKSAPVGFYESGSPNNDNTGTVFLGMYDMSSLGTYDLPALLFHEGIPGHHLQSSVMMSRDIPEIRKYYVWWSNTAFTEGWALYAEYLADELGLYRDDYAQFGRLAGELWRACRLVVDSGLHLKQWSRAQAIEYLNVNTASSEENNARAVDRYLAVPGQATAFKIGMQVILDVRHDAEQRMGDDFDLAKFHALLLRNGPLPLTLLREEVEHWVGGNFPPSTR